MKYVVNERLTVMMICVLLATSCMTYSPTSDSTNKSSCKELNQLLTPLNSFVESWSPIFTDGQRNPAKSEFNDAADELSFLVACSSQLTEVELLNNKAINRDKCDPFPISVTLTGLKGTLNELSECNTDGCLPDETETTRRVIKLQFEELRHLHKKCTLHPDQSGPNL